MGRFYVIFLERTCSQQQKESSPVLEGMQVKFVPLYSFYRAKVVRFQTFLLDTDIRKILTKQREVLTCSNQALQNGKPKKSLFSLAVFATCYNVYYACAYSFPDVSSFPLMGTSEESIT